MSLCRPRRKKKPSHIMQVSTTFMLFHFDRLSALGGKQRLIFINKALWALDGRMAVEGGWCWRCFAGMVTWTTCHCKKRSKLSGDQLVHQLRSSNRHSLCLQVWGNANLMVPALYQVIFSTRVGSAFRFRSVRKRQRQWPRSIVRPSVTQVLFPALLAKAEYR